MSANPVMEGEGYRDVYRLLKSPVRQEIVSLLYTRGELSAAQLKVLLNVSYGTLYYHLDFLRPLLVQVGRGRYRLNERGVRVAERLFEDSGLTPPRRYGFLDAVTLSALVEKASGRPLAFLPLALLSIASYLYLSYILHLKPVLLHLVASENPPLAQMFFSPLLVSLIMMLMYAFMRRGGSPAGVIVGILLSYLPVSIYLVALAALNLSGLLGGLPPLLIQAGFIAAHIVQLIMLAASLTYSGGIRWERSLLASLIISYLGFMAAYYQLL